MTSLKHVALLLFVTSFCRADGTVQRNTPAAAPLDDADALNSHGADLQQHGRSAEAEAEFRRALNSCRENGCRFQAAILTNMGSLFHTMARYGDAESVLRQAIEASSMEGQEQDYLPVALVNLAAVYRAEARFAEAEALYERALRLCEDEPTAAAREIPRLLTHMAALGLDMGNPPQAEVWARQAVARSREDGTLESADGLASLVMLEAVLVSTGKLVEAESI